MSTTSQVVELFAQRLLEADDKQAAGDWVLRQVNKMKHKAGSRPISFEEKKRIVELVGRQVTSLAKAGGADSAPYTAVLNHILENLDEDEAAPGPQTDNA